MAKLTDKQKEEIRKIREDGTSYNALAAIFGVSVSTIMRVCRPDYYKSVLESNKKYVTENMEKIRKRQKENGRYYKLTFHVVNDAKIIKRLESQENVQGYIRSLIKADIEKKN